MHDFFFDPVFPVPAITALALAASALVAAGYLRSHGHAPALSRLVLGTLRLAFVAGLTLILLRPMRQQAAPQSNARPNVAVLFDTSGSMNTRDADAGDGESPTRFEFARERLCDTRRSGYDQLTQAARVSCYRFDQTVQSFSPFDDDPALMEGAEQRRSDIAGALMSVGGQFREQPGNAILLISDGQDNVAPAGALTQTLRFLRQRNVPVWTCTIGSIRQPKDVNLVSVNKPNYLLQGQPATLKLNVANVGYHNWNVEVEMQREDRFLLSKQVVLQKGLNEIEFPIVEQATGDFKYGFSIKPLAGEADKDNNRRSIFVNVIDTRPRVLFLEARPYWDSKFILQALRDDPNVEVVSIFQLNRDKKLTITDTPRADPEAAPLRVPESEEDWAQYNCIVLGRGIEDLLTPRQAGTLKTALQARGGNVIFARGQPTESRQHPLWDLLPLVWSDLDIRDAQFELTEKGRASSIFNVSPDKTPELIFRELPRLISVSQVSETRALATIFARSRDELSKQEIATVAWQRYGQGKVLSIGSIGLWRWAFLDEELEEYDAVFQIFWSQLVRWMVADSDLLPGQNVSFYTDHATYNVKQPVRLSAFVKGVNRDEFRPRIMVVTPEGKTLTLTAQNSTAHPDHYSVTFEPAEQGDYSAILTNNPGELRELVTRFAVYASSPEMRFVAANFDVMDQIAEATGGGAIQLEQLGELARRLQEHQRLLRQKPEPTDLWDRINYFWALIALLGCEWLFRRMSGLC